MEKNFLQFDQSIWWLLLIIVASAAIAWFLYKKSNVPWTKNQNRILTILRFAGVFLVLFLFLEPLLKKVTSQVEAPAVAIAVDNSQSVIARSQDSLAIKRWIEEVSEALGDEGIEVRQFYLDGTDSLSFDHTSSNFTDLFRKATNIMEGKNWVSTIFITDGIFNRGSSPIYESYTAPVFTVGLGDTIPPKDINISRVLYNRVSFKGNETPIRVEVKQGGYDNKEVVVSLRENGEVLDQQRIRLTETFQEVEFIVSSEEEELRRLSVTIPVDPEESTDENNRTDVFMEVIDGRRKVLITADAPHPDIKAIRSTLEVTGNYETEVFIPSVHMRAPDQPYDVIIYHGIFPGNLNLSVKGNPGTWFILVNNRSVVSLNRHIPYLSIEQRGGQPDRVTGVFNQSFNKFKIPENVEIFEQFPPLEVPFGEYNLGGATEVLLYQKLGSVNTRKPLMVFYDDGLTKSATLMGENIWKWKLQESAIYDNNASFQDFVTKTIQFLSVKSDKKRLTFRSRGTTFSTGEAILFDSEVYNDIYERVYGNTLSLRITSPEGETRSFEFIDSEFNSSHRVPSLESGIWSYQASVVMGEETFTDQGQFLVEEINPEYLNLTADHNLLRVLASKTGGEYVHFSASDQLVERLRDRDFKNIIRSSERFSPLIQDPWMLILIFLLFSAEWGLRKYWGGY